MDLTYTERGLSLMTASLVTSCESDRRVDITTTEVLFVLKTSLRCTPFSEVVVPALIIQHK